MQKASETVTSEKYALGEEGSQELGEVRDWIGVGEGHAGTSQGGDDPLGHEDNHLRSETMSDGQNFPVEDPVATFCAAMSWMLFQAMAVGETSEKGEMPPAVRLYGWPLTIPETGTLAPPRAIPRPRNLIVRVTGRRRAAERDRIVEDRLDLLVEELAARHAGESVADVSGSQGP